MALASITAFLQIHRLWLKVRHSSSNFDTHRAMIRALDFAANERALEARTQRGADQKIIQAPPDVPLARGAQRTPPGIMTAAFFKFAEGIDEAGLHERVKSGALLFREPVVVHVRFRIREIDFRVRYI